MKLRRFMLARPVGILCAISAAAGAQSTAPLPQGLHAWTLSASPVLSIGAEGDSTTEFQRIAAVTRMPSGEIVVSNSGTAELRVFSPTGAFIRSLSRRGQGPGELQNPGVLFRARDTLFVLEFAPGGSQAHVFTLEGGFRTRYPVRSSAAPGGVTPIARLATGEWLVVNGGIRIVHPTAGLVTRDTMSLGVLRIDAPAQIAWLGTFPNSSWLGYASPSMRDGVGFTRYTFGPSRITAVSDSRVWTGDSETGEITIFDASGKEVARTRSPMRPRPFSGAALERARQRALASASTPDQKARTENLFDKSYRPRTAPLFTRFLPAAGGQMAVELFREDPATEAAFIVFDAAGKPVAGFVAPSGVTVQEIGSDYALGIMTDDDGVERVVLFRLRR